MATKVTAIIKYDLFPHFTVEKGELQDNGDVRCESGVYSSLKVITTLPAHVYAEVKESHRTAQSEYDKAIKAARDHLIGTYCAFLPLSYLQSRGYKK